MRWRSAARTSSAAFVLLTVVGCGSDTVGSGNDPVVTSISVVPVEHDFTSLGSTIAFSTQVRDQNGRLMSGVAVTWTSSAPAVVSMTPTGTATAEGNGSATISASVGGVSGSAEVSVDQEVALVDVAPESATISVDQEVQLTAQAHDPGGSLIPGQVFTWASMADDVASVSDGGLVKGHREGLASVSATAGGVAESASITVTSPAATVEVSPTADTLVSLGDTIRLSVTARDHEGTDLPGKVFAWTSSATDVATVDQGGLVTAVANGVTTVSATADGVSDAATITVAQEAASVVVSPTSVTLTAIDETRLLVATVRDALGHIVIGPTVSWSSSAEDVATVTSSGLVTAVGNGSTIVSATFEELTESASITVATSGPSNEPDWTRSLESHLSFYDVWGSGPDDVFAVSGYNTGDPSTIYHFDGTGWAREYGDAPTSGTHRSGFFGVWGTSPTNVYAVGGRFTSTFTWRVILRFDGSEWTSVLDEEGAGLSDVWGSSGNDIFAVGSAGQILHFDGSSWTEQESGTTNGLWEVWGTSPTNVYAVGDQSTLLHYDGISWTQIPIAVSADLNGIWGSGESDIFIAAGLDQDVGPPGAGVIIHYDGTSWTSQHVGTQGFNAVWGASSSDVFAVGGDASYSSSRTTVYHFDGTSWSEQLSMPEEQELTAIWGSSGADVFATAPDGRILHYDGIMWTTEPAWRTTFIFDMWAHSPTELYAVGIGTTEYFERPTGFKVLRYSGNGWSTIHVGSADVQPTGVWSSSSTDIFVVGGYGSAGYIFHYDGTSWVTQVDGTVPFLDRVWGASSTDVWAVGRDGTILHYDGTAWSPQSSGTGNDLHGVWGFSNSDVFAVGEAGTILHFDGTAWSPHVSGTTATLMSAWGTSSSDVFAVGTGGRVLHYDGTSWATQTSGTGQNLADVWGTSSTDVFAVGFGGAAQHYDGGAWTGMTVSGDDFLLSVWGTSTSDVFIGGASNSSPFEGLIFHGTR